MANLPSPGVDSPTARAQLPTRDRLVRTAARLFLARSYSSVGVNEICTEAGVQKGSFYHFFPSKSDLAIAVLDHHAAAMWAMLDAHERAARGPINKLRATATMVDEVQCGLVKSFGLVVGCPLGNLAVELSTTDDSAGAHAAGVMAEWEERIAGHCRDAAEVGLLAPETDPEQLAHLVIATMQGMILLAKVADSSVSRISAAVLQAIDSGLRKEKAA